MRVSAYCVRCTVAMVIVAAAGVIRLRLLPNAMSANQPDNQASPGVKRDAKDAQNTSAQKPKKPRVGAGQSTRITAAAFRF